MRIEHVRLSGVAPAGDLEFSCAPSFNLIIGRNGSGKSQLLHALSQTLRRWPTGLRLPLLGGPTERDASVQVRGLAPDGGIFVAREDRSKIRHRSALDVAFEGTEDGRARALLERVERGADLPLPLLAHATPDRGSRGQRTNGRKLPPDSRLAGWQGAMDIQVEPDDQIWFKKPVGRYSAERLIAAIRPALIAGLPDFTNIQWQETAPMPLAEIAGGRVPWGQLPASYRAMIGLVGGLAWRAAVLDGSWDGDAAARVGGVVLLEEVERHLDLNWQRRVVEDLRRAFPRVQFIATSHSPFVVQSMRADEVINLDGGPPIDFQRRSIEDITEEAMGVPLPQRSARWQAMYRAAAEFFERLEMLPDDTRERVVALERLDELSAPFADDPAFTAFLALTRRRGLQ